MKPTLGIELGRHVTRGAFADDTTGPLPLSAKRWERPTAITMNDPIENPPTPTNVRDPIYPLLEIENDAFTLEELPHDSLINAIKISISEYYESCERLFDTAPTTIGIAIPTTLYTDTDVHDLIASAAYNLGLEQVTIMPIPIAVIRGHLLDQLPGHTADSPHIRRYVVYHLEDTLDVASVWVIPRGSSPHLPPFEDTAITHTDNSVGRLVLDGVLSRDDLGLDHWQTGLKQHLQETLDESTLKTLNVTTLQNLTRAIIQEFAYTISDRPAVSLEECCPDDLSLPGEIPRSVIQDQTQAVEADFHALLGGDTNVPLDTQTLCGGPTDSLYLASQDDRIDHTTLTSEGILVAGTGAGLPGLEAVLTDTPLDYKTTPYPTLVGAEGAARIANTLTTQTA